jgi:hypothetical protein
MALAILTLPATAQTIAEGQWINLFDGESTFGWTVFGDGNWRVENGLLTCDKGSGGWVATTSQFANFELQATLRLVGQGATGLVFRGGLEGHPSENGSGLILLKNGSGEGEWQTLNVRAIGSDIAATVNGNKVDAPASRSRGYIGIQYHSYHSIKKPVKVEVKEIKLRPLNLTPLFDGKTLTGWNIIPDHASKFNVVDGALNITDGNGQIETAGTYRDFILQLDIISNGEHLNSGVFFRGPVGVFWKGYESQVRNQWIKDDRTRPVDYGTGGLYGVQETRKVVPSDHEWFNKTIVCEGNHFAVWINGYQVSDVWDTRPVDKNGDGKNGYVPQAGTIHLQGHDPTTNLSFKNINLQEYPAK